MFVDTECTDYAVDDDVGEREDPIRKCYIAAKNQRYTVFSLAEGKCYASNAMSLTYPLYHMSSHCQNGVGSENSTDVYFILQPGESSKSVSFCPPPPLDQPMFSF